jgi:hypothetical protein
MKRSPNGQMRKERRFASNWTGVSSAIFASLRFQSAEKPCQRVVVRVQSDDLRQTSRKRSFEFRIFAPGNGHRRTGDRRSLRPSSAQPHFCESDKMSIRVRAERETSVALGTRSSNGLAEGAPHQRVRSRKLHQNLPPEKRAVVSPPSGLAAIMRLPRATLILRCALGWLVVGPSARRDKCEAKFRRQKEMWVISSYQAGIYSSRGIATDVRMPADCQLDRVR